MEQCGHIYRALYHHMKSSRELKKNDEIGFHDCKEWEQNPLILIQIA